MVSFFCCRYATSLMGAEEIHVDNFLFTSDSNQVVTGSIYGPPQVWDMTVSTHARGHIRSCSRSRVVSHDCLGKVT